MDLLFFPFCGLCRFRFQPNQRIFTRPPNLTNESYSMIIRTTADRPERAHTGGPRLEKAYHVTCFLAIYLKLRPLPCFRIGYSQPLPCFTIDDMCRTNCPDPFQEIPLPSVEARRLNWLSRRMTNKLMVIFYPSAHVRVPIHDSLPARDRIPVELWCKISSYLCDHQAVETFRPLWWRFNQKPRTEALWIDQGTTLWVQYIIIEGVRYIYRLSAQYLSPAFTRLCSFRPRAVPYIFIASDHLGVRDIIIKPDLGADTDDIPDELPEIEREPGVGWNIHPRQRLGFCLLVYYDVTIPV